MEALAALASAFFFAVGQIWVRIGLQYGPPLSAVALSNAATALWVWLTLVPFVSFDGASPAGIYLYMFLGVLSPLGSQALLFASTLQVGISRASPIRNTAPLVASLLSVVFLGEQWTTALAIGTVLIILGGTLLGMRDSGDPRQFKRSYLILPLLAAFLGGVSSPLRKFGFSLVPSFPLATCALMAGGMLALLAYLAVTGKYKELIMSRETILWFGLSGFASGVGMTLNLWALEVGTVVIVAPLIAATPLFTVILSALFLRSYEKVTTKIALGAAAICLGGIILVAFRS
ncbi:MAG: DMT family transporter [Deltaproteobacteria bacterium]|nr:DMT family transporter [Deltaproteobacteria bacterium]